MNEDGRQIDELSNDELDAICTHGPLLARALARVGERHIDGFFLAELDRLTFMAEASLTARRTQRGA